MKLIIKNQPPRSFETYCNQTGANYNDIDPDVKDDLNEALLNEQGWLCGYCQQKIKDMDRMSIEHHCEQSICNGQNGTVDKRLDYKNMMAVCLGKTGRELHCDSSKATFKVGTGLPIQVSPWINAHIAGIKYSSVGTIKSFNPNHSRELDTILYLNLEYLKNLRKNIWVLLFKAAQDKNGQVMKDKMRRLTERNVAKLGNKYPEAFPGLYEYMFKKFG